MPLHNDLYTQSGLTAAEYRFPYEDQQFDKAFLFSVFTHMQPDEIVHYLIEIERVLKKGGRCLATFFLYKENPKQSHLGQGDFIFKVNQGDYWLMDRNVKSANVALSHTLINKYILQSNLKLDQIIPGNWDRMSSSSQPNDFQDIVVLTKP